MRPTDEELSTLLGSAAVELRAAGIAKRLCEEIDLAVRALRPEAPQPERPRMPTLAEALDVIRERAREKAAREAKGRKPRSRFMDLLWQMDRALDRKALAACLWAYKNDRVPGVEEPDESPHGSFARRAGTASLGWRGARRDGLIEKGAPRRLTALGCAVAVVFEHADEVKLESLQTITWGALLDVAGPKT